MAKKKRSSAPQHCRKALSTCMKGKAGKAKAGSCMRKFNTCRR
jgi:hypothetical protein